MRDLQAPWGKLLEDSSLGWSLAEKGRKSADGGSGGWGAGGIPGQLYYHRHLTFIFNSRHHSLGMQIIKITIDVSISYNLRSDYI